MKPKKDEGTIASLTFEKEADGSTALKTIGNVAFKYQRFPSIEIPKSVNKIGNNPFSYNPALVSFTFEEGTQIKTFGTSLIANCPLIETFTVPKTVTTLGNNDFENCISLKSVIFEEGSKLTKAARPPSRHPALRASPSRRA
ncbi:MAG: leucine-rich repeat domain-containing protein [Oscillospiraceae bacterium]|nr:MAG: leucine-rich repeat domain-containing protein [Oscillospiraceae bacterium]